MAELKVTAKGQVTLRKDILKHLGVRPGEKIQLDVLPNGKVELQAVSAREGWDRLSGLLAGKTKKVATIEEMNDAIERGWAGLP